MDRKIEKTLKSLIKNGFDAVYCETADEAKNAILESVGQGQTVGIGGSMTVQELEIHESLIERGNTVYWHWLVDPDKRNGVRALAKDADVYLSSTNAITEDGKLVSIDGHGNRVASMIYGHKMVCIVAGSNKITSDLQSAIDRIKVSACPPNARRLNLDTPCNHTGKCNDCSSPQRMCNATIILDKNPRNAVYKVFLVNESLGF